ncbi:hypothetical protein SAMN04487975_11051 [Planococcus glaciei]|uniref:group-specific protein n=1 Tax=Planococcus glaciei TaxID=459472 RepID=UPI00088C5CBA|nr:group-specific protein [Planococcus glaciei]SDH95101.1 hypothetical protein SAMN04487975_11051 [Planococcus glaciei]
MAYVYHMVPKKMMGNRLIPLNQLKSINEELYEEYKQKYFNHPDRPKLLERSVPKLDCLWNDVLHFLPLHPYHIYQGLQSLGIPVKSDVLFFQIPVEQLKENPNALYHYPKESYGGPAAPIQFENIELIDIRKYKMLETLPEAALAYYKEENEQGRGFGMFAYIPHLLSLGEVDVAKVDIINWSSPINSTSLKS